MMAPGSDSTVYTRKDRAMYLTDELKTLWKKKEYTDYTLQVGEDKFELHRVVLSATSQRYRDLVPDDNQLEITGLNGPTVEEVLAFIYTNKITLLKSTLGEITKAAKYFRIPALLKLCTQFKKDGEYESEENVFAEGIRALWKISESFDFTIMAGRFQFRCHKVVLVAASPFFKAELSDIPQTGGMGHYKLNSASAESFKMMLKYIYTGKMDVIEGKVQRVLEAGKMLQIPIATAAWSAYLLQKLTMENWMTTLPVFKACGFEEPLDKIHSFLNENILKYTCPPFDYTDTLKKLKYEDLRVVIDKWKGLEHQVFSFICQWMVAHNERTMKGHNLLCHVRFCLLDTEYRDIFKERSDEDTFPWHKLQRKAAEYHMLPMHQRVLYTDEQNQLRKNPNFLVFHKNQSGLIMDNEVGKCFIHDGLHVPEGRSMSDQYLEINNFLIAMLTGPNPPFYIFDPRTMIWYKMSKPLFDYEEAAMAHDGKRMYIAGGWSELDPATDQVDRYDFKTNKWKTVSRLPILMNNHAACVLDNGLYISGGFPGWFNEYQCTEDNWKQMLEKVTLKTFYRMDLTTHEWEIKAPMLRKHSKHNSHLLTIDSEKVLCILNKDLTFEYYSSRRDQWSYCVLNFIRPHCVLDFSVWVVRNNKVYLTWADTSYGNQKSLIMFNVAETGRMAEVEITYFYSPESYDHFFKTYCVATIHSDIKCPKN